MGEGHCRRETSDVVEARRGSVAAEQSRSPRPPGGGGDLGVLLRDVDPVTAARVLGELQRSRGNREVGRVIGRLGPAPRPVQRSTPAPVQRAPGAGTYVPHKIHVRRPMTRQEFHDTAMTQVFGGPVDGVVWRNSRDEYLPEHSPYTVRVSSELIRRHRAQAAEARGIDVDDGGGVTGAAERVATFHARPGSDEKSALLDEVDRRYHAAVGDTAKIQSGESGKAALWRTIRDEVLFQHEYLAHLPDSVTRLIRVSVKGRDLTPADYDRLFAIAKKIERLPPGHANDYAAKVTASTTDLAVFEAALDRYTAEMAERAQQAEEREQIHTKLVGLEQVYDRYRSYLSRLKTGAVVSAGPRGGAALGAASGLGAERAEIETQLQAHGFAGISEFEAFIARFEKAFEQGAVTIVLNLLGTYAGRLYRESERYQDPAEVSALHVRLGGVRRSYAELETNAKIWNDYVRASEQSRLPGQGHLRPRVTLSEAEAAREKAVQAKAVVQAELGSVSGDHPILQEEGLPPDKKLDKAALARAGESELGGLLQRHIRSRTDDVAEARALIVDKPEHIYTMDKLFPQFYVQMGIEPGSVHDKIIRDKMRADAVIKLVKGIALAVVAVALAVVSFGTATPAIVAAGAAVTGAGLGAYMALEEYQQYTEQQDLADVGLADDPSVVWLVLAVVGAGLDMAAAVKAVRALGPAAKAFNAAGDLDEFTRAVQALERAHEIDARIARAAERAAAARTSLAEASGELTRAMAGKVYSFPGPLADPEVYRAVVKLARSAIRAKLLDAQKFIDELRAARVKAGLGELAPEELARAKQAWAEAKAAEAADLVRYERLKMRVPDVTTLDALIAKAGDPATLERLLDTFPAPELQAIFAQLADGSRLALMLDHVGAETGAGMVRQWMAKGKHGAMNDFMTTMAGGVGKELAETSAVGATSLIIDSNTAIALMKEADPVLRATMNAGEKARVAFIKSLPADTELRIANVTVGEVKGGVLGVKGVPIDVVRTSPEYQRLLSALDAAKVGAGKGFADRGLIADAFFATTAPGVRPRLLTADQNAVKRLAGLASIDVNTAGGYPGLLKTYGKTGFDVTLEGRTLTVIPVP